MLDWVSIESWGTIYRVAYYFLLGSLIIGAAATGITFMAGNKISNDLTVRLANATALAGEANRQAADVRLRAAEIERKYAWRAIQPDEKAQFLAALKDEKFPVILEFETSDPEAFEYADQFFKLLKSWNTDVTPYNTVPLPRPRGICINGTPEQGRDKIAMALAAAGLQYRIINEGRIGTEAADVLRISIGGKFPPSSL